MFTPFCSADLSTITTKQKRELLKQLRESIKHDVVLSKGHKLNIKAQKENEKKAKIQAQIKAAADKLAKLQAKLA
jgi:hypothetical protein